jgi:hypothetical protein
MLLQMTDLPFFFIIFLLQFSESSQCYLNTASIIKTKFLMVAFMAISYPLRRFPVT